MQICQQLLFDVKRRDGKWTGISSKDYKFPTVLSDAYNRYLSWVYGVNRKFRHEGH